VLEELDATTRRIMPHSGVLATRVPRQTVVRYDEPRTRVDMAYAPMLCLVPSGRKLPDDRARGAVRAGELLVNLATAPVVASFVPPYLSVTMTIDLARVAAVDADVPRSAALTRARPAGELIGTADPDLVDAFHRWLRLHETPEDIPALAGRYEDEILYRVLRSPLGTDLRRLGVAGEDQPIRRAIAEIAEHYASASLTAPALARAAGLSESTFFERFRSFTGLTPQRYIKRVRLQRARELLEGGETAAAAAAAVGYVSAAHFSRDYSRQYGASPRRHIRELTGVG
jgi:AraC-like DNA-binding protein